MEKKYTWLDRSLAFSLGLILGSSGALMYFIVTLLK